MNDMSANDAVSAITESYISSQQSIFNQDDGGLNESTSVKLCGREKETLLLQQTYADARNTKEFRAVAVHGASGCGKTALLEASLRNHVLKSGGLFCAGKYFQQDVRRHCF